MSAVADQLPRLEKRELFFCYRLLAIMWFLFGGISSSSWCLGWAALLAHIRRRLIDELIVYPCSGVWRPSGVRPSSTISNIFFSKTALTIKAKFYVEPPWVGGTTVCSRYLGHMIKMAATPIYCKNPSKIFFSGTSSLITTKLRM